jgi:Fic family protein
MAKRSLPISERTLNLCSAITRLLGRYEGFHGAKPQPKLRKLLRIKTIQGSLAIEGNSLSTEQVTALLDGKHVVGLKRDILEAQNANIVYGVARDLDPYSIRSLLRAHGVLMQGIAPDAGLWRSGAVGILKGSKVSHLAPKAEHVQGLVKDLLAFARKSTLTPLLSSSIFHHEFELIHPFSDGNGRMGRLWQHVLLARFHPMFEFVPVESVVRDRQRQYYAALEQADQSETPIAFVEFMLAAMLDAAEEFLGSMRAGQVTADDRLEVARERFQKKWFSRRDYLGVFVRLSSATASRDLASGVERRTLERHGDKALTRYRFR